MVLQTMMMNTNKNNPLKKVGYFFEKVFGGTKKRSIFVKQMRNILSLTNKRKNN